MLRVVSESDRWIHSKTRFKCVCPDYCEGEYSFRPVDGVLWDKFIVNEFTRLSDEDSQYFEAMLSQKTADRFTFSRNKQELAELRKKKDKLSENIKTQV